MIQVKNLSKHFGKKTALHDVSITFENGMYGLLGPNGAGKTTLMRMMLNLYKIKHGDILFDEVSIKTDNAYMKNIGYLPQKFGLYKEFRVDQMMQYIATLKQVPKAQQKEQIASCLELINLTDRIHDKVGSLSGGMLRRLGIAQALLGDAKVIIVDEPTAGLDPEERVRFKNLLASIKKERIVILSTHIVEDIEALCDRIIVLNHGEVVGSGDSASIRKLAENKVFHIPSANEADLKGNYFIEKRYVVEDQETLRVLSAEEQNAKIVSPTIEDGYMCLIKGMVSMT